MPRGRKRKHPELDRLDGNPSNRPAVVIEVEGIGEVFVPAHLPEEAAAVVEIVKAHMPERVYSAVDSYLLCAFAMEWYVHTKATHMLSDPNFDWTVKTAQGTLQVNPWAKELTRHALALASLGAKLGLDPTSRMALKLPKDEAPRSKFDGLIGPSASSGTSNVLTSRPVRGRGSRLN